MKKFDIIFKKKTFNLKHKVVSQTKTKYLQILCSHQAIELMSRHANKHIFMYYVCLGLSSGNRLIALEQK